MGFMNIAADVNVCSRLSSWAYVFGAIINSAEARLKQKVADVKKGDLNGLTKEFYESGKLYAEGVYTHGRRKGIWTYWYEDGRKLAELKWRSDARFDRHILKNAIGWNRNGSRNGTNVKTTFATCGGVRIGMSRDGKRIMKTTYKGWLEGPRVDTWLNGVTALKGQYAANSRKTGEWIGWDERGNESFRHTY